jgi:threonine dehydrogenase-like Zn-dependent dehydrogenase
MKALVYQGPGRMDFEDVPEPVPGPGEVTIRVRLAAVCGSDLHGFREASPRRIPPLIMGHEAIGVVEGAGDDGPAFGGVVVVKPFVACGTCVTCREGMSNLCTSGALVGRDRPGAFAERLTVPATHAVPVPDGTPGEAAVLVEPLANAIHVVRRSVRVGDDVVVIGAGPIGLLTVKVARLAGAGRVAAVDRIAARRALAEETGADLTVAADADAAETIMDATKGRGADIVIDAAGFEQTWDLAVTVVRPAGRIEVIGLGQPRGIVDYHRVASKEVRIAGSFACTDDDFDRAVSMVARRVVGGEGWITRMPLAQGRAAFERLVDPATDLVKVAFEP